MDNPNPSSNLLIDKGEITRVTLNRPEVRNSFNEELIADLNSVFESLGQDKQCKVIVLQANGKSFCAGADLKWMKSMANYSYEENVADSSKMAQMLNTIYTCPKPVIARVQGDAYAGGVGLTSVCDILIASKDVRFCISEARLGLIPATIAPYVIRALGEQAARRYFLTAEVFTASQAKEMGFVHELVDPTGLDEAVDKICSSLLANGAEALKACKKIIIDLSYQTITPKVIEETVHRIAHIRNTEEAQKRMKAFLET